MPLAEAVDNCGLIALKGIIDLKNVSMFTLIHLARDNGMKFYFCKVDTTELMSVPRPAILHSHNHFVLIEDNKALPDEEEYTGWVLSPKPIGMTLPYSLAKQIMGAKKAKGFLGSILPVVGAIVGNIIAPGIGGIIGGALGGGGGAAISGQKGLGIGIGALTGGLGGLAPGAKFLGMNAGLLAGGAKAAGALASGQGAGGALMAGLGGYAGQKFTSGAAGGAIAPHTGILNQGGNILSGGVNNLFGGGGSTASKVAPQTGSGVLPGGGMNMAPGSNLAIGNSSLGSGNFGSAGAMAGSGASLPTISGMTPGASNTTQGKSGLDSLFGNFDKSAVLKAGAGALAGSIFPRPELTSADAVGNYDKASKYLEGKTLPGHTNEQLNKYLNMSIPDIQNEILGPQDANRSMLELDKKYQESLNQVQRMAANSGQSVQTSSDAFKQYQEVQRQWGEAKANLWGDLQNKARTDAIQIHQWALQQSIAAGQFDVNSAMKLAEEMGKGQQLQDAITQGNYENFQSVIADLLAGKEGGASSTSKSKTNPNQITINLPSQMAGAGATT